MLKEKRELVERLFRIGAKTLKGWETRKNVKWLQRSMKYWEKQRKKAEILLKEHEITVKYENFKPIYNYKGFKTRKLRQITEECDYYNNKQLAVD